MGSRLPLATADLAPVTASDSDFTPDPSLDATMLLASPVGLMVEYTSRCNLRCKYCTKSNPGDDDIPGRNMDMAPEGVDAVLRFIAKQSFKEVLLAGTGESTFHPDWKTDFPRLIAAAKTANPKCFVHFNSNFALRFSDDAWPILAQLDGLMVSIDTADAEVTRHVRAKSDLAVIVYNLTRLRAHCRHHQIKVPRVVINVTLHEAACAGLPDLMSLLADLPVAMVSISDMVQTEAATRHGIRPLNGEDRNAMVKAAGYLRDAMARAKAMGKFTVALQPFLAQRINALLQEPIAGEGRVASPSPENQQGVTTKLCTQPWTRFTVAADASIYPCCVTDMPPVGSLAAHADPERDGIDGVRLRRFRQDLLLGNVPKVCVGCTNAADGAPQVLQDFLRKRAHKAV
jgi:MoaA/NifB/PqqE/SkfB family radical SAM enzyme